MTTRTVFLKLAGVVFAAGMASTATAAETPFGFAKVESGYSQVAMGGNDNNRGGNDNNRGGGNGGGRS